MPFSVDSVACTFLFYRHSASVLYYNKQLLPMSSIVGGGIVKLLPYRAVLAKPIYVPDSPAHLQNMQKTCAVFNADRACRYQRETSLHSAQTGLHCVISSFGFTTKDHAEECEHAKAVSSMPFFPLFSSKTCRGRMTGCRCMRRVTTFLRQPQQG